MPALPLLPLVLFAITYLGLAVGRLPGLAIDRAGIAALGAVAFLVTGAIPLAEAKASIDVPTLAVLFAMMLLSAEYRDSGLYDAIGRRLAAESSPRRLLLATIAVTALLSAVLTNDVACFALTPLLAGALLAARRDPLPYLLALACASNLGSAATPIGNPQNILIAQSLHLRFLPFLGASWPPVVLSLAALYLLLARRVRGEAPGPAEPPPATEPLDRLRAGKALALTVAALLLFVSPVPQALSALGIAALALFDRRRPTRELFATVDWNLLVLFVGLFVVVRGFELSGWTAAARDALFALPHVGGAGGLSRPGVLVPAVAVLSNLVSNVPAVMLLLPFTDRLPTTGYALALASTFAGNAVLVGSIANLIVAEQAARLGIRFGFREHVGTGLAITALSLVLAAAAIALW